MKEIMKESLKDVLIILFIFLVIANFWQGLELLFNEGINPSASDSVIAMILAISLRKNLKYKLALKETVNEHNR